VIETEHLLKMEEAASFLGITRGALYKRLYRGDQIPFVRLGKLYRFRESELSDYVEELKPRKQKKEASI
jgi:excisionase family DNA binding protein